MHPQPSLRKHLADLLAGGNAHLDFDAAVADLAPELRGRRPHRLPYSPWELIEHMRLAQWDILEFSRNPAHASPDWPEGYWPPDAEPHDDRAWEHSISAFRADRQDMISLLMDESKELLAPLPWGDGQSLLREVLVLADHNAYHLGQLIVVRRLLGAWEE